MTNNDILKRIRYALDLKDPSVLSMMETGGFAADGSLLSGYFADETDPLYKSCSNQAISAFLDGLIYMKRGPGPEGSGTKKAEIPVPGKDISMNNSVMKKLRIALELKDDDILRILNHSGFSVSKPELSAIFRRPGHKNFRECGDQMLRNFLKGLTDVYRGSGGN